MNCPKCGNTTIKSGFMKGKQRHKCKTCSYQFTKATMHRGKSQALRHFAIFLYLNRMTIRSIAKTLQVSPPTILNWIKATADGLPEFTQKRYVAVVEMDELWHYLETKKKNFGYSKPSTELQENCLPLCWVLAPSKRSIGFMRN